MYEAKWKASSETLALDSAVVLELLYCRFPSYDRLFTCNTYILL